ncbi:zinc finger with UFM1-specific peptidase domain protein-like isoform X1 [Clarias magur]|uniref:Zinc finger-containing ubiquitin peptidase 1 n=1 Tax=Clarias magur TaxID=1594786 RepID=A0A8J4WRJ7_CLAMG|nr:zinc finger with UFM1-specific peptidase domain protein-like isoform X1 [Clarias magur]
MPVCVICSEELICDSELKTHLLLTHLEDEVTCPLCSLSGVCYDELQFHMNTAHRETGRAHTPAAGGPGRTECGAGHGGVKEPPLSPEPGAPEQPPPPKHRRLTSPSTVTVRTFSCPMCDLVCTDCFMLQEHVELHLQDQAVSNAGAVYVCPMCDVVCEDSHSLQEHVELHLDCNTAGGDVNGDLQLAQQLQEEDERQRKEEEARREAEEFTQLQRQFGMDNCGGYRKQMETSMQRAVSRGHMTPAEFHMKRVEMMETLAMGLDDGRTRTTGLLSALYQFYQRDIRDTSRVWLCAEVEHFSSSDGDRGWGCGYRNFQMLLSSLQRLEPYTSLHTLPDAPSIPRVQALIEAAWAEGIDPQGAAQFNRKLKGTRAWIGATEIYAVLTSLRLRVRIVDFHQPTGPGDTHPRLLQWVKNYFSLPSCASDRTPPRVVKTNLPPIYLQHQGHSRSIIGVEERRNGSMCVLLFDPGCSPGEMRKLLGPNASPAQFNRLRKFPAHLKHKQYQVVSVEGVLCEDEKQAEARDMCDCPPLG